MAKKRKRKMDTFFFVVSQLLTLILFLQYFPEAWSLPAAGDPPFGTWSGCRPGDRRAGLADLKSYLHLFGYLPSPPAGNFSDHFDGDLQSALRTYQRRFGLNATGTLDASTLSLLTTPRCGVADIAAAPRRAARHLYSFFPGRLKWPPSRRHLTYAFTTARPSTSAQLPALFARCFARWSAVTSFTFSEVASGPADITIGFYRGAHGDSMPFDGRLGIVAHSFAPTSGRLHLDAAEEWVVDGDVRSSPSPYAMDLESVVLHEIGHILGLGHSTVKAAVMWPFVPARSRKVDLAADDITGIHALYSGSK